MTVANSSIFKITDLKISIPSEVLIALRETENQFTSNMKRYTALVLFQNRKLSVGQCAELANMTEEDFTNPRFIFLQGRFGMVVMREKK